MNRMIVIAALMIVQSACMAQQKAYNTPSIGNPFIPGYFADPPSVSSAIPIIYMPLPTAQVMVMAQHRYG